MTIQGKKKIELTREGILSLISNYDIYRYYFGDFKLNVVCCNHLRGDRNPSFLIGTKYGEISHHDFADSRWHGDAFSFVQQIHSCDFDTALKIIDKDLGLGILKKGTEKYKEIIKEYKQPEELGKRYSLIQCITRPFTKEELKYWEKYSITKEDLRRENIYAIKKAFLNKKLFSIKDTDLRFGYLYESSYWKLYFPHKEKKGKWISNVPLTCMDGKENIKDCETAWITKSKKDKIILLKLYPHVASTQNESISCFSEENINFIKNNSKKQIIFYDSDDPGVKACKEITNKFSFDYCNPPRSLLPNVKDFSDMVLQTSLKNVEKYIKNKLLL